jgi:HEAT repeat protein
MGGTTMRRIAAFDDSASTGSDSQGGSLAEAILLAIERMDPSERRQAIADAARNVPADDLTRAMGDQVNAARRNVAMEALTLGGSHSIPALVRSLTDPDPEVVMFAASVLGKSRDPAAIPHLVALLEHDDINVAQAAIDSLSQLRPAPAVDALIRVLDRDPWLRFAAVHALGEIADPRAIGSLLPLLEDEAVREIVIEALGKIGSPEALSILSGLLRESGDSSSFGLCLRAIGELLTHHPDDKTLRRVSEWMILRTDQGQAVQERLLAVLAPDRTEGHAPEYDVEATGAAAMVVRALQMRPLYTALIMAGRHPALRELLQFCAVSIGAEIAPAIRMGLSHFNGHVRALACRCAGAIGLREFAPRIVAMLGDAEATETRVAAIEALWRLNDDASVPALISLFRDDSAAVREAARGGLTRMNAEAVTNAILWEKFVDPVPRKLALEVARANPHPRQMAFVRTCLSDPNADVRVAAVQAIAVQSAYDISKPLEALLVDPSIDVRRAVVRVLARTRRPRVAMLLLAHLERDSATRAETIAALAELGDASIAPHLVEVFERESEDVRLTIIDVLTELREPIVEPMLVRLLADASPTIRRAAARATARFGTEAAMRHLFVATRDQDQSVRAEVAELLPLEHPGAIAALERLCMDSVEEIASIARRRLEAHRMEAHSRS